jgi:hypothetical protein
VRHLLIIPLALLLPASAGLVTCTFIDPLDDLSRGTDATGTDGGDCLGCVDPKGGPYNYMFVTEIATYTTALSHEAADDACNQAANKKNLPGSFVAWYSDPGSDAVSRLASASGWIRADKRPFAASRDDLLNGRILFPARLTADGVDVVVTFNSETSVVTATSASGTYSQCSIGDLRRSAFFWTASGQGCGRPGHLYCLGIDHGTGFTPVKATGKKAFVTHDPFPLGARIEDADGFCKTQISDPDPNSVYRALLATTKVPAYKRLNDPGAPWVRLDGIPWVMSYADLSRGSTLSALNVDTSTPPQYLVDDVWTGIPIGGDPSSPGDHDCAGWTSASSALTGSAGVSHSSAIEQFSSAGHETHCDARSAHLFCLEQ